MLTEEDALEYEQLFHSSEIQRHTVIEIAETTGKSEYAIRKMRKDPDYQQYRLSRLQEMREDAFAQAHTMAETALQTLFNLCYHDSGHVRYEAAAKIVDVLGIGNLGQVLQRDERDETNTYLREIMQQHAQPKVEVHIHQEMPAPQNGGLLPTFHDSSWQPTWPEKKIVDATSEHREP